jgi:antirestriction protein
VRRITSYNAGKLHGKWIDCDQDSDIIWEEIREMLKESPEPIAEDWAIHDYENFGDLRISEYADIEKVAECAQLLEKHGLAFAAYASYVGEDYATEESFEDAYCGEWDSEKAYAEDLFDECYAHDIPENLRFYMDYEAFARDLFIGDCFSIDSGNGTVYVFRNC